MPLHGDLLATGMATLQRSIFANPEVSLMERVTNSIDATFERLAEESSQLKKIRSPHKVTMQTYFS